MSYEEFENYQIAVGYIALKFSRIVSIFLAYFRQYRAKLRKSKVRIVLPTFSHNQNILFEIHPAFQWLTARPSLGGRVRE